MKTVGVLSAWAAALALVSAPMGARAGYAGSVNTAAVCLQAQASGYWRHEAAVSWRVLGEAGDQLDAGSVAFATFVWP